LSQDLPLKFQKTGREQGQHWGDFWERPQQVGGKCRVEIQNVRVQGNWLGKNYGKGYYFIRPVEIQE